MDRCALITGCSSGIGRATALAFRAEGWDVVATSRKTGSLDTLRKRGCRTWELDVTDPDTIESVVDRTIDEFGHIDCLVNNSGISEVGPLEDIPDQRLQEQFDVNVFGPHRLIRAVLPHMRAAEEGTIVNVSSVLGLIALPGCGAYSGSKFAMEAMSDSLRMELQGTGVDVVLIEPGSVETKFRERASDRLADRTRTDTYNDLYRVLDDWAALDGIPTALAAETVAAAIVNAASATQPDDRYVLGPVAKVVSLGRFLPSPIRDGIYSVILKVMSARRGDK